MFNVRLTDIIKSTLQDEAIAPEYIDEISIDIEDDFDSMEELEDLF